jgi:hypothetical protein
VAATHAVPAKQAKVGAQSALEEQLVLQLPPEQTKLLGQFAGSGEIQAPAEQAPAAMTWVPEQVARPHEPVGNKQVWFA